MRALLAGLMALSSASANAEAFCGPRADIIQGLREIHKESRVADGLFDGRIMEIFAARRGGSWTVVITDPNGTSCIVAAGSHFFWPRAGQPI